MHIAEFHFDVMLIVFLHFSLFFMIQNILNRNIFSIFLIPSKKMADINHLFSSYIQIFSFKHAPPTTFSYTQYLSAPFQDSSLPLQPQSPVYAASSTSQSHHTGSHRLQDRPDNMHKNRVLNLCIIHKRIGNDKNNMEN